MTAALPRDGIVRERKEHVRPPRAGWAARPAADADSDAADAALRHAHGCGVAARAPVRERGLRARAGGAQETNEDAAAAERMAPAPLVDPGERPRDPKRRSCR